MRLTERLLVLSRQLHECSTVLESMVAVNAFIADNTRYRACWVTLQTQDKKHLETIGYMMPDGEAANIRMASLLLDQDPFLQSLFSATEPFVVPDLRKHPQADQAQVQHFGNRTLIAVPLLPMGDRIGAMLVGTFADQGVVVPTTEEEDLIVRVASLLTLVFTRVRAEERERELNKRTQANQRLESLGRLAGEIAHDFNNILTTITGNTELALSELDQHLAEPYLLEVQAASRRAADLSRQLLTFSKGGLQQPEPLDLCQILEALARMLERLIPKRITVQFQTPRALPLILGERIQIEQLVMNLVLNARDAIPGQGRILVHTTLSDLGPQDRNPQTPHEQHVCIAVQDSGGGIPEAAQEQIFEPFFTTKDSSGGTGLGLSVVKSVVEQHKGHLRFSTSPQGTTFRAYFPTTQAPPPPAPEPAGEPSPSPSGLVLVVDDQPQIRRLLTKVLERAGYQVAACQDGIQALSFVAQNPQVVLVLTDVSMPRLGGIALLKELQRQSDPPAVVLMSGYTPDQVVPSQGAHVLNKPFGMKDMLQLTDRVLRERQVARAHLN